MNGNNFLAAESLVLAFLYGVQVAHSEQCDASSAHGARSKKLKKMNSVEFTYTDNQLLNLARVFYLLNSILLLRNKSGTRSSTCTERDLYYCNPPLFAPQGQRAVHCCLQRLGVWMRIAASCLMSSKECPQPDHGTAYRFIFTTPQAALERRIATDYQHPPYSREDLGVVAAPKSILLGPLSMMFDYQRGCGAADGMPVPVRCDDNGLPLTTELALYSSGYSVGHDNQEASLVFVEKESTLLTLSREIREQQQTPDSGGNRRGCLRSYLMLCTRGYPCVASRLFMRRLNSELPQLPLLALVDGDPHGLRILLTMLEGGALSSSCTKEFMESCDGPPSSAEAPHKAGLLPLQWVGVRPSVMSAQSLSSASLMPLSVSDGSVLRQLEQRISAHLAGDVPIHACARTTLNCMLEEIQWMWRTRLKGELQACLNGPLSLLVDFPVPMRA